jgi:hypothetical protein
VSLHLAVLVLVPGCALAAWWQINRAEDGNQLSYLYSVMWPAFAILSIYFWWMLIHTDFDSVGLKGMRRQQAADSASAPVSGEVDPPSFTGPRQAPPPIPGGAADDPELMAYNERLAALAAKGPKTWRTRERVVVRRDP